jgi:hypothetical protein
MAEKPPDPGKTPVSELMDLAAASDPETPDGIFLRAVAEGITSAQLDQHQLDAMLDED